MIFPFPQDFAHFRTDLERELLMWNWRLFYIRTDGTESFIAQGSNLTRRRARSAAGSWERVWLRQHGRL